jgi:hypothetical protein
VSFVVNKKQKMKKTILIIVLFLSGIFCFGQNGNDYSQNIDTSNIPPIFQGGKNFNDGSKKFRCFIDNNIDKAKINSKIGKVCVTFIIDSTGLLKDIKILRHLDSIIENELIRVLEIMPKWKPGIIEGKPVSTPMNYCLNFPLENNNCY